MNKNAPNPVNRMINYTKVVAPFPGVAPLNVLAKVAGSASAYVGFVDHDVNQETTTYTYEPTTYTDHHDAVVYHDKSIDDIHKKIEEIQKDMQDHPSDKAKWEADQKEINRLHQEEQKILDANKEGHTHDKQAWDETKQGPNKKIAHKENHVDHHLEKNAWMAANIPDYRVGFGKDNKETKDSIKENNDSSLFMRGLNFIGDGLKTMFTPYGDSGVAKGAALLGGAILGTTIGIAVATVGAPVLAAAAVGVLGYAGAQGLIKNVVSLTTGKEKTFHQSGNAITQDKQERPLTVAEKVRAGFSIAGYTLAAIATPIALIASGGVATIPVLALACTAAACKGADLVSNTVSAYAGQNKIDNKMRKITEARNMKRGLTISNANRMNPNDDKYQGTTGSSIILSNKEDRSEGDIFTRGWNWLSRGVGVNKRGIEADANQHESATVNLSEEEYAKYIFDTKYSGQTTNYKSFGQTGKDANAFVNKHAAKAQKYLGYSDDLSSSEKHALGQAANELVNWKNNNVQLMNETTFAAFYKLKTKFELALMNANFPKEKLSNVTYNLQGGNIRFSRPQVLQQQQRGGFNLNGGNVQNTPGLINAQGTQNNIMQQQRAVGGSNALNMKHDNQQSQPNGIFYSSSRRQVIEQPVENSQSNPYAAINNSNTGGSHQVYEHAYNQQHNSISHVSAQNPIQQQNAEQKNPRDSFYMMSRFVNNGNGQNKLDYTTKIEKRDATEVLLRQSKQSLGKGTLSNQSQSRF